jgi:hypothetical protein
VTDKEKAQLVALAAMETIQRITHVLSESISEGNRDLGAAINIAMLPFAKDLAKAMAKVDRTLS